MTGRLLLAGLLVAAIAGPAGAHDFPDTPKDAPTMAGPLPGGARLVAFDHHDRLCLAVVRPARRSTVPSCGEAPATPRQVRVQQEFGPRPTWHFAAVPPEVAEIELELRDGRRVRGPTVPGEGYRGSVGAGLRFFLAESDGNELPELTRLFGADGTLLAVREDPFGDLPGGPPPGARPLASSGGGARLYAYRDRRLAPTPLEPERYDRLRCVELYDGSALGQTCVPAGERRGPAVRLDPTSTCTTAAATGIASGQVRRVVLVLGDGSRVVLRAHRSEELAGRRGFGALIPGGLALRRWVGLGRDGRGIARGDIRQPPAGAHCPPPDETGYNGGFTAFAVGVGVPPRRVPAGAPAFLARDRGDLLCVGPGVLVEELDCALPPLEAYESRVTGVRAGGRTLIAGVVAPPVSAVEVVLDGGERLVLPAGPHPAYEGRYADHVRFVAGDLPGRRSVLRARLLGLPQPPSWPVWGLEPPEHDRVELARAWNVPITASLRETVRGEEVCVRFGRTGSCGFPNLYGVEVRCGAKGGILVAGVLRRSVDRVVGVLAAGARRRAVIARPPAGYPRRPRVFLLPLARDEGLERIVAVGAGGGTSWQRLPPAAEQCGYDSFGVLLGGGLF